MYNNYKIIYFGDGTMCKKTCCFIGHRKIEETSKLKSNLLKTIERLITENKVDTFLFGSKSQFNNSCWEIVTQLKEKYPQLRRIYVIYHKIMI